MVAIIFSLKAMVIILWERQWDDGEWQGLVRFRVSSEGELIGLAGALDMGYEGKRGIRDDFKVLRLSS